MDQVPFEFRERVAAVWKCCESGYHEEGCLHQRVPDCEWTMKSKKRRIDLSIGHDNGEWMYGFGNPDRLNGAQKILTMDELLKNPDWKHVAIRAISVRDKKYDCKFSDYHVAKLDDTERLMKLVMFLSNEPRIALQISVAQAFISTKGAILLNFLSKMTFSSVLIGRCYPGFIRLLENQFLRRKPTEFEVLLISEELKLDENRTFFEEHLMNGNLRRFRGLFLVRFSREVMERIVNRFLENPENYEKGSFDVTATFQESINEFLDWKTETGKCKKDSDGNYRFEVCNTTIKKTLRIRVHTRLWPKATYDDLLVLCCFYVFPVVDLISYANKRLTQMNVSTQMNGNPLTQQYRDISRFLYSAISEEFAYLLQQSSWWSLFSCILFRSLPRYKSRWPASFARKPNECNFAPVSPRMPTV